MDVRSWGAVAHSRTTREWTPRDNNFLLTVERVNSVYYISLTKDMFALKGELKISFVAFMKSGTRVQLLVLFFVIIRVVPKKCIACVY